MSSLTNFCTWDWGILLLLVHIVKSEIFFDRLYCYDDYLPKHGDILEMMKKKCCDVQEPQECKNFCVYDKLAQLITYDFEKVMLLLIADYLEDGKTAAAHALNKSFLKCYDYLDELELPCKEQKKFWQCFDEAMICPRENSTDLKASSEGSYFPEYKLFF